MGDGVVVEDPEVLGSEQGCHLRRAAAALCSLDRVDPEGLEVVERRAAGLVAVHLFGECLLQIRGQTLGDRIVRSRAPAHVRAPPPSTAPSLRTIG